MNLKEGFKRIINYRQDMYASMNFLYISLPVIINYSSTDRSVHALLLSLRTYRKLSVAELLKINEQKAKDTNNENDFFRYKDSNAVSMKVNTAGMYFHRHLMVLKMGGITLIGKESLAYRVYSYINVTLVFAYPFLCIPIFINGGVQDFTAIFFEIVFVMADIKILSVFLQRKKLGRMLIRLEQETFTPNFNRGGISEYREIEHFIVTNNLQTKLYWMSGLIYVTIVMIYTVIQRIITKDHDKWATSYIKLGLINTTYSPNYELTTLYQNYAGIWIGVFFTTIDLIIGGVLCNITCQLKILQNFLRRSGYHRDIDGAHSDSTFKNLAGNFNANINWIKIKNSIKTAVDYHIEIIRLVKEVEDVFSIPLMLVFLNTLALLASLTYLTSTISTVDVVIARRLIELGAAIFQVYIVCYWGDRVQEESENVTNAAYDVSVAVPNLNFQRAMKLIILRSQTPIKITAGKFTDIGLTTFAWILRTSYSAFMVLRKSQLT